MYVTGTSNATATLSSTKKYTPEEEEAARLSLSEEIVDMLEARYGTAMHSGEASPTSGNILTGAIGNLSC